MPKKKTPKIDQDALLKEYRMLARRADDRLRALEHLSADEYYENVTKFAYARAQKDAVKWGAKNPDKPRFNRKPPVRIDEEGNEKLNIKALRAKVNDIKHFLYGNKTSTKTDIDNTYAPNTSTKTGIDAINKKRADTMSDRYGWDVDWHTLATYYRRSYNEKFARIAGSKTVARAIGQIEKNAEKIRKNIAQHKASMTDIVVDNDVVADAVQKLLHSHGRELKSLGIL